jgi:hypothetical protein
MRIEPGELLRTRSSKRVRASSRESMETVGGGVTTRACGGAVRRLRSGRSTRATLSGTSTLRPNPR